MSNTYNLSNPCELVKDFTKIPKKLFTHGMFLTDISVRIYIALLDCRNETTDAIFPSYRHIKKMIGSKRDANIRKGLLELERFGWILKTRRGATSNTYEIRVPLKISPTEEEAFEWLQQYVRKPKSENWKQELDSAIAKKELKKQSINNDDFPW